MALVELELEQPPATPEAMEAYFQEHVATAEALAAQGELCNSGGRCRSHQELRWLPVTAALLMGPILGFLMLRVVSVSY